MHLLFAVIEPALRVGSTFGVSVRFDAGVALAGEAERAGDLRRGLCALRLAVDYRF